MIYVRPFTRSAGSHHDYMTVVNRIYEFGFRVDPSGRIVDKWHFIVCGNVVKINTGADEYDRVVSVSMNNKISREVWYHGDIFYDSCYRSLRFLKFESILVFLDAYNLVMDKEQHKVFEQLHMLELL